MSDSEKVSDWVRWVNSSPEGYKAKALWAVWKADGDEILRRVLKKTGLEKTEDLVKAL